MDSTTATATPYTRAQEAVRAAEQDLADERGRLRERGAGLGQIERDLAAARSLADRAEEVDKILELRAHVAQLTATRDELQRELEAREQVIKKREKRAAHAREAVEDVMAKGRELRCQLELERNLAVRVRADVQRAEDDLVSQRGALTVIERKLVSLERQIAELGSP